jgi:hypothetical protein
MSAQLWVLRRGWGRWWWQLRSSTGDGTHSDWMTGRTPLDQQRSEVLWQNSKSAPARVRHATLLIVHISLATHVHSQRALHFGHGTQRRQPTTVNPTIYLRMGCWCRFIWTTVSRRGDQVSKGCCGCNLSAAGPGAAALSVVSCGNLK